MSGSRTREEEDTAEDSAHGDTAEDSAHGDTAEDSAHGELQLLNRPSICQRVPHSRL